MANFIPVKKKKEEIKAVNIIDGNYKTKSCLTQEQIDEMRRRFKIKPNGYSNSWELAKEFNVTPGTVKRWTKPEFAKSCKISAAKRRETPEYKEYSWKQNRSEAAKKRSSIYRYTEEGFIVCKWADVEKFVNNNKKDAKPGKMETSTITREEFMKLWSDHKSKFGMKCYYTGVEMVIAPGKPDNLVSVERVDPNIGYTKDNTVFCCLGINFRKHDATMMDILQIYKLAKRKGLYDRSNRNIR